MNWGKAIRTMRAQRGITQRRLARLSNCNASYISLIESGRRSPSLKTLETFAKHLDTPVWYLAFLASDFEDQKMMAGPALAYLATGDVR